MSTNDLLGIAEIADLAKVSKQAVTNWRSRYSNFPQPVQNLQSGPVWDREKVETWIKSFKGEETHVLSFINLRVVLARQPPPLLWRRCLLKRSAIMCF
jgi:chromosome partitioning protein